MTTTPPPEALAELSPEMREAALAGLKAWSELPDDERSGERPWIMGFNAGWEACEEQRPTPTDSGEVIQGDKVSTLTAHLRNALADEWDTSYFRRGARGDYVNPEDEERYLELTETDAALILEVLTKPPLRDHRLAFSRPEPVGAGGAVEEALATLLRKARGYVETNHDEGCELDIEWGEDNFNRNEEVRLLLAEDGVPREWPGEAECTCGNVEFLAKIDEALVTPPHLPPAEPVGDCPNCHGNGYSRGKVPPEDMQGEYDCACEVCLGTGQRRPEPKEHTDVIARRMGAEFVARPEPVGAGEPVAWMYHHPGELEHGFQTYSFKRRIQSYEGMSCNEEDAGVIETPLYARPEPVGDEALVERVARAIRKADQDCTEFLTYEDMARAAIQAIPAPATGEREQIVAWLCREAQSGETHYWDAPYRHAAKAIARGDHRTQSGEMEGGEHG